LDASRRTRDRPVARRRLRFGNADAVAGTHASGANCRSADGPTSSHIHVSSTDNAAAASTVAGGRAYRPRYPTASVI
jgi:hypothetical protein